jgi:tetratricopeptide (TPR) repeat protein
MQYHIKTCDINFARSGGVRSTWFAPARPELTAQQRARIKRAFGSAQFVNRWGLFEDHRSEYQLAWLHLLTGDERSFETKTRQLLEKLPKDAALHWDYSEFLRSKQRLDEASLHREIALELELEHLRKAVELDASSFEARVNLANWLFRSGQVAQAVLEYEDAIELNPEHAELRLTVAQAYAAAGQYSEAEAHLERAVELAPTYIPAHRMLIDLAQFQGDIEKAKKLSQRMLKLNPKAAQAPN